MDTPSTDRNLFQRLLGLCATRPPADRGAWTFDGDRIVIDLNRAPELAAPHGAIRLEKNGLPERVLVVHGDDGFHAFRNRCTHAGRRLDPVPGHGCVQCCSIGKSTFDWEGQVLSGSAKSPVVTFPTTSGDGVVTVSLHVAM